AIAPARLIKEYATKFDNHFFIKGGFMDGKVLSVDEVNALAAIPPLPILRAQVLGTMLAPIAMFAAVVKAIAEKKGGGDQNGADTDPEAPVTDTAAEAVTSAETQSGQ
ncbi:MAG: hypothetical protein LBC21_01175, partial [Oscillospiraceae bacterium]|nr:hypothetical protein [Oscillospiraceae bacterium]